MAIEPERSQMFWEASEHHQNLSLVGSGANGSLGATLDTKTGLHVAVKKLTTPFQSLSHA